MTLKTKTINCRHCAIAVPNTPSLLGYLGNEGSQEEWWKQRVSMFGKNNEEKKKWRLVLHLTLLGVPWKWGSHKSVTFAGEPP